MLICILGFNSIIADVLSTVLYFYLLYSIFRFQSEVLLKYLWFVIFSTWTVFALLLLENGNIYLRGNYSKHYGSLPTYIMGWIIFYITINILESRNKKKISKYAGNVNYNDRFVTKEQIRTLTWISAIALSVLLICFLGIIDKPYFLLSIDRFEYSRSILPSYISLLLPWLYAVIPLVIMIRKEKKWLSITYLVLLFLLCYWMGEKFTGLMVIIYFLIISLNPAYIGKDMAKKIRKIVIISVISILGLLIIVYMQQVILDQVSPEQFVRYLGDRIAAQGELWWLTYAQDKDAGMHIGEIFDEIKVLIFQASGDMVDYNFGIYKLMKKFMNTQWVYFALQNGVRATESTRATFFYYGKHAGLILGQTGLAALIYFIVNRCVKACNKRNWIEAVLYMYIMRLMITATMMSDFQLLTQKKVILIYILLIFIRNKRLVLRSHHRIQTGSY